MRHRKSGRKFSRNTKARNALLKSLCVCLIENGHITTTQPKAKELQRSMDKLFTIARTGDVHARRQLHQYFGKRDIANLLVDCYVPALNQHKSGITKISYLGNRAGDNAPMAHVTWVETVEISKPNSDHSIEKKNNKVKNNQVAEEKKVKATVKEKKASK